MIRLITNPSLLKTASSDFGRIVRRIPKGIFRPQNAEEIRELIHFARKKNLKVIPQGQRHTTGGQALVEQGIAIDMSSLSSLYEMDGTSIQAAAGARWIDVVNATLPHQRTPPVLPDFLELTIGGTLSVGGIGCQSAQWGALTDHIMELEVVTGRGEIVKCSAEHHADLFHACRGGLGQFGIITRARIRLVRAPEYVRYYKAVYNDLNSFLTNLENLVLEKRFDTIQGFVAPGDKASLEARFAKSLPGLKVPDAPTWIYYWEATRNIDSTGKRPEDDTLLRNLSFLPGGCMEKDISFFDFVTRVTASFNLMKELGLWEAAHPWLNVFVPANCTYQEIDRVLKEMPVADMGQGPIAITPLIRRKFETPFLQLPRQETFFLFALLRHAVPSSEENIQRLLNENQRIFTTLQQCGGVRYMIDAPYTTATAWAAHFGKLWPLFLSMKEKFDPCNILVPLPGI